MSAAKADDDVDDSFSLTLLRDIREIWPPDKIEGQEPRPKEKCESSVLVERLKAMEESPWQELPITQRKLARMLKPFEVAPRTLRIDYGTAKGYLYDNFQDAFSRYIDGKA